MRKLSFACFALGILFLTAFLINQYKTKPVENLIVDSTAVLEVDTGQITPGYGLTTRATENMVTYSEVKHPTKNKQVYWSNDGQGNDGAQSLWIKGSYKFSGYIDTSKDNVPDCDTAKLIQPYPCKIPLYKDGKVVGWTEKNLHGGLFGTGSTSAFSGSGNIFLSGNDFKFINRQSLIQFQDSMKVLMSVSSQDSTGAYTVHFAKSKVHFINDSTFTFKIKP